MSQQQQMMQQQMMMGMAANSCNMMQNNINIPEGSVLQTPQMMGNNNGT